MKKPVIISISAAVLIIASILVFVTFSKLDFSVGKMRMISADGVVTGFIEYPCNSGSFIFSGFANIKKIEKYTIQSNVKFAELPNELYEKYSSAEINCNIISQSTNKVIAEYSGFGYLKETNEKEEVAVRATYMVYGFRKPPSVEYEDIG